MRIAIGEKILIKIYTISQTGVFGDFNEIRAFSSEIVTGYGHRQRICDVNLLSSTSFC